MTKQLLILEDDVSSIRKLEQEIRRLEDANADDPQIQQLEQQLEQMWSEQEQQQKVEAIQLKRHSEEERYDRLKQRITNKSGNYLNWMDWAESLYSIEETKDGCILTSTARKWTGDRGTWSYPAKIDCLEHIEKLIGQKIIDRNRGHGDTTRDLEVKHEVQGQKVTN